MREKNLFKTKTLIFELANCFRELNEMRNIWEVDFDIEKIDEVKEDSTKIRT